MNQNINNNKPIHEPQGVVEDTQNPNPQARIRAYVSPEPTDSKKCRVTCPWLEVNPSVRFYGAAGGICRLFTRPIWDMKRDKLCIQLTVDEQTTP